MVKVVDLTGREASNLVGAFGEIIAWDTLRKMGIQAYKIGSWSFFPSGYPRWEDNLNDKNRFLTREQTEYVKNKVKNGIVDFDLVGVKYKGRFWGDNAKVEGVYLIEVKAGRGSNIKHYIRNPMKAFTIENIKKAKTLGFKILLVVVELLDDWRCEVTSMEL